MWQATQFRDTNAINGYVAVALNLTVRRYFKPELERRSFNFSYMTILRAAEFFFTGGFKFGARFFREESAFLRTPSNYHHGGGIQNDNMTP